MKVLFSEGSSLSARETLTALGPLGYEIIICDPNPLCICRFSKYTKKYYKCPPSSEEPLEYYRFILEVIEKEKVEVLLPVHEQALLFSKNLDQLKVKVKIALPSYNSYLELFSKIRFMRLLDMLSIPHPDTWYYKTIEEIQGTVPYPCYVKTEYGTASSGVWKVESKDELNDLLKQLAVQGIMNGSLELLVQESANGQLEIAYGSFEHGNLISLHCCQRQMEGARGSSSSKVGVSRPIVKKHFESIGKHLRWHGPLAIDYLYDEEKDLPLYIDASPRLVEPMNAFINGVNFPELQVKVSLGKKDYTESFSTLGKRSHMILMSLLGIAERGANRRKIIREIIQCIMRKGVYAGSMEELTNGKIDWLSIIPLLAVIVQVLINPANAKSISNSTVRSYALSLESIKTIDACNLVQVNANNAVNVNL